MADIKAILRENTEALIPVQETRTIIQGAVENSIVLQMGRRLPNMSTNVMSMPVLDMLPMAYWVDGDTGYKQTSTMAWSKKRITAGEIAVIIPIPEAVLDDAEYDIWGEIKPRIQAAMGQKVDEAVLFGINKPPVFREDILTTVKNAGNAVTETADIYADIMGENGVIAKVEEDGYLPTGAVSAIKMRGKLRGLVDKNGRPLFRSDMQGSTNYALDGMPMYFPRNGSFDPSKALMIVGDFSQLVYSIRQDITFKLLTEAPIVDPNTKEIIYALAQQDMVAIRAVMRLGWEIPNPINYVNTDSTTRAPFAAYLPAAASGE